MSNVQGHQLFSCANNKGVIVDPRDVQVESLQTGLVVNAIYDADAVSAPLAANRTLNPRRESIGGAGYLSVGANIED
jgi:hypothetical protein